MVERPKIDLSGRVALVLGGSRGIGGAITRMLCRSGALTFFTHTGKPRYRERIETLLKQIKEEGGCVKGVVLNACDSANTTRLVEQIVKEHGKIDILVANVGQNLAIPAEDVTDEDWHKFLDINLSSAFYGVKAVLKHMVKAKYGRIILIGSSAVYDGGGGAIDYAAGKAGLEGMMKYLTRNYTRKGILTNIVHPCVIDTDLLQERYSDEEKRKKLQSQIPVGRLGKPEDIAGLVAYLVSSWGDYICGQAILIDGGRTFFGKE